MARLKAHGRELLRIEQEKTYTEDRVTWRRWTRAYMADGKILEKIDVRWAPDAYHPAGELYTWGWKIYATIKKGLDPVQVATDKVALIRDGKSKWALATDTAPAVVLNTARVLRAVQSGESLGFCKSCGATAHNVEPDARNYACESCGELAVYGAEECLL